MASNPKTSARPATPLKPSPPPRPKAPENSNPNFASRSPLMTKSSSKSAKSASRNPNLSKKTTEKKKAVVIPMNEKLESKSSSGAQPEEKISITTESAGDEKVEADKELCVKVEVSESGGRVKSGVCRSNIKRGNVMNLIQAFEKILTLPPESVSENGIVSFKEDDKEEEEDDVVKKKRPLFEDSSEVTESPATESLNLDSGVASSSWDGSLSQESISKRTSSGGRRSRRNVMFFRSHRTF